MKTRSGRVARLSRSNPRLRQSVDDDNAPSVTPTSPNTSFAPHGCGADSASVALKAVAERLKKKSAAAPLTKPRRSSLKSATTKHFDSRKHSTKGEVTSPTVHFDPDTFTRSRMSRVSKLRRISKPGSAFVTLKDLKSPRSPKDRRSSGDSRGSMQGSRLFNIDNGGQRYMIKPTSAIASQMSGALASSSPTSARSSFTLDSVAEFERKHRAGRRLGSFGFQGGRRRSSSVSVNDSILGKRSSVDDSQDSSEPNGKRRRLSQEQVSATVDAVIEQIPHFVTKLEDSPGLLRLYHVGPIFSHFQNEIQLFTEHYFDYAITPEQRSAWPLHELESRYLPLMLITQYIADGSQYGWRNFFTNSESRSVLASGIIGEWLSERVFNHTAFGFDSETIRQLEDMDREYLHFDAFTRSKKRAIMIKAFLARDKRQVQSNLIKAGEELAEELLTVLEPLLPTFFASKQGHDVTALHDEIKDALTDLVTRAAIFHRAIRVLGEDGTLVRIAPAVQKGSQYYRTAPFIISNGAMVTKTKHHGISNGQEGKLKIKMTCFPRVEAYVPHGPDAEELTQLEHAFKTEMIEKGEDDVAVEAFDWEDWAHRTWPELPRDCVGDVQRTFYGKALSDEEGGDVKMLGAYVTTYPHLASHRVYCEWDVPETTKEQEKIEEIMDEDEDGDGELNPVPKSKRISLKQAIAQARREAGAWRYGVEDGAREIWNFVCRWEPLVETGALVWFIQSWIRGGHVADSMSGLASLATPEGRKIATDSVSEELSQLQGRYLF